MYHENIDSWRQIGGNRGLSAFTPETQALMAVEIVRTLRAIETFESKTKAPDAPFAFVDAALKYNATSC